MVETVQMPSEHTVLSPYVIVCREITCPELLWVSLESGEEVLPVFSSEETARRFLMSCGHEEEWRIRECSAGELISLLLGPCANVERVFLDPLTMEDPLAVPIPRESFVASLFGSRGVG